MNLLNYIKGFRKGKEARRIEVDAMRDPFLAEAIEGFDSVKGDHAARIAAMQKQVSVRTKPRSGSIWISSIVSAAAVALFILYFTVLDKPHKDYTDSETLFVYLPDNYLEKKRVSDYNLNPVVEIKNMDILSPDEEFDIYVPDDYVEKRKRRSDSSEKEKSRSVEAEQPTTHITNIEEIFAPEVPIEVYIPDEYLSKEKQNATPRVQIDNISN